MYADPVDPAERAYFDIRALGEHDDGVDRRNLLSDFSDLVQRLLRDYEQRFQRRALRILLVGRWHSEFRSVVPDDVEVTFASSFDVEETELVTKPLAGTIQAPLHEFDIVLLHELLEAVPEPVVVLGGLAKQLGNESLLAVVFANMSALPSRVLRRRWRSYFDKKVVFYGSENLEALMWRLGFQRLRTERLTSSYSLGLLARRLNVAPWAQRLLSTSRAAKFSLRATSGRVAMLFEPTKPVADERVTIVVPVYNEERYVGEVLTGLLAKDLPVEREIVIVESGSTDGSGDIVRSFEGRPDVRVIYQDAPKGKGSAVRLGLEHATGTIFIIQDADFEYDLDDYEALLEPILQRRASFVLGSRSLGLDDWKVRQYGSSRGKGLLMNLAQIVFAQTFNLLYQQRTTDINTMFKVFRRECIEGCTFRGNGFNFDIELVCKIVKNGFAPLEVPVNYVSRGFDEGKKINFLLDAYPSYFQLFRCRFGRL